MKVQASMFLHLFEPSSFIHTTPKMETVMIDEKVWIVKKIGVEQSLTNIQAALREKGYEVVSL